MSGPRQVLGLRPARTFRVDYEPDYTKTVDAGRGLFALPCRAVTRDLEGTQAICARNIVMAVSVPNCPARRTTRARRRTSRWGFSNQIRHGLYEIFGSEIILGKAQVGQRTLRDSK